MRNERKREQASCLGALLILHPHVEEVRASPPRPPREGYNLETVSWHGVRWCRNHKYSPPILVEGEKKVPVKRVRRTLWLLLHRPILCAVPYSDSRALQREYLATSAVLSRATLTRTIVCQLGFQTVIGLQLDGILGWVPPSQEAFVCCLVLILGLLKMVCLTCPLEHCDFRHLGEDEDPSFLPFFFLLKI